MEIALIGEGAYPHQFGGVSVWCDQLVRGLPEHDFHVVALVATGQEPVRWELPGNVTKVTTIPLWGRTPFRPVLEGRARRRLLPAVEALLETLVCPPQEGDAAFASALRDLAGSAQRMPLAPGLCSDDAVAALSAIWRAHRDRDGLPELTLHDAVTVLRILEHSLRPLAHPPLAADVCHIVTNGMAALPGLVTTWERATPLLVTEHGIYLREQYLHSRASPLRWPVKDLMLAFARRLCTVAYGEAATVAPGNAYNRRWEERLGAPPARIRTVYNGVDPAGFPLAESEPDVPTIAWAGRIDPVKDLETLLRAFAAVRRVVPDARLRCFGGTGPGGAPYLQRCEALAAELGVTDAVRFEGRVADIREAYLAGHVVVLCSITEGFPYTLIEAMSCGRACVATEVGGVPEALGDAGLMVPPRDPDRLAGACVALLRDEALRHRLGAAARARILGAFTLDQAVTTYDEMYAFLGRGRDVPTAAGQ